MTFILADDQNLDACITKLIKLATTELTDLMTEIDGISSYGLNENLISEKVESVCHTLLYDNYMDPIFGHESRISQDEWLTASTRKPEIGSVWYKPQSLRNLIEKRVK